MPHMVLAKLQSAIWKIIKQVQLSKSDFLSYSQVEVLNALL